MPEFININEFESMDKPDVFVPHHMRDGLMRYFNNNIECGSYMNAVLEGDLYRALQSADVVNRMHIVTTAKWIAYFAPSGSFGSKEAVSMWLERD